ncbi:MAG: TfoX/Sxy family protein [Synergistaceae bacterium]|jgi:DNA transformation protein|nr:TfoX/Sxy family protein [Synergistaceae bacterium]
MAEITSLNLGNTMEKKLKSVGICSAEALREVGSKGAVLSLKAQYPSTCVVILYHLEAALQGVEMKQLDPRRKAELKAFFNQIKDRDGY